MENYRLIEGRHRPFTAKEYMTVIPPGSKYRYVVTVSYILYYYGKQVVIPEGFLFTGVEEGGEVYDVAWLIRDWLYRKQRFTMSSDGNLECTKEQADQIVSDVLAREFTWKWTDFSILKYCLLSKINFLWLHTRSWTSSGVVGPEFLPVR